LHQYRCASYAWLCMAIYRCQNIYNFVTIRQIKLFLEVQVGDSYFDSVPCPLYMSFEIGHNNDLKENEIKSITNKQTY
jgi:hypothetical protein